MPLHTIRSDTYLADLLEIWDYAARTSIEAADQVVGQIEASVQQIGDFPDSGERLQQFGEHCRRVLAGKYAVYYDRMDDHVNVLRVIHSARSVSSLSRP